MSKLKLSLGFVCALTLVGCNVSNRIINLNSTAEPEETLVYQTGKAESETKTLASWWTYFGDETLNKLMRSSMNLHAHEAAGTGVKIGSQNTVEELTRLYTDKKSLLARDISSLYIQFRSLQGQNHAVSEFIDQRVMLVESLGHKNDTVSTTFKTDLEGEILKARKLKIEIMKEAQAVSLSLAGKTGLLPEYINQVLKKQKPLPTGDITPVLATSAIAFSSAPQMRAYQTIYKNEGALRTIFPDLVIGDFFGVSGQAYVDQNSPWQVKTGTFSKKINLSSVSDNAEGNAFREGISSSLFLFQANIIRYSELGTQYKALNNAYAAAADEHKILNNKYVKDGTFMTAVMEAQKNLYDSRVASLKAQHERLKALVSIYSYFGVY